jgi:hypothetical protein
LLLSSTLQSTLPLRCKTWERFPMLRRSILPSGLKQLSKFYPKFPKRLISHKWSTKFNTWTTRKLRFNSNLCCFSQSVKVSQITEFLLLMITAATTKVKVQNIYSKVKQMVFMLFKTSLKMMIHLFLENLKKAKVYFLMIKYCLSPA